MGHQNLWMMPSLCPASKRFGSYDSCLIYSFQSTGICITSLNSFNIILHANFFNVPLSQMKAFLNNGFIKRSVLSSKSLTNLYMFLFLIIEIHKFLTDITPLLFVNTQNEKKKKVLNLIKENNQGLKTLK